MRYVTIAGGGIGTGGGGAGGSGRANVVPARSYQVDRAEHHSPQLGAERAPQPPQRAAGARTQQPETHERVGGETHGHGGVQAWQVAHPRAEELGQEVGHEGQDPECLPPRPVPADVHRPEDQQDEATPGRHRVGRQRTPHEQDGGHHGHRRGDHERLIPRSAVAEGQRDGEGGEAARDEQLGGRAREAQAGQGERHADDRPER